MWKKRCFDFAFALLGLAATWWLILGAWLIATIDTRSNGFFRQTRIGRYGAKFKIVKIKTMVSIIGVEGTITGAQDPRITRIGAILRRYKIDELPQLFNVLIGDMSFVGPRPDVPGYADRLEGSAREILSLRPGITGPASLKYRNEGELLSAQDDPLKFNDQVIYPDKVRINLEYLQTWSLRRDIYYIFVTLFKSGAA